MRAICLLVAKNVANEDLSQAKKIAESALRLTPQVTVVGEAVFLEVSQCAHLMSEGEILKRLDAIAYRMGASFKLAIGSSPGEALARVRLGLSEMHIPERLALPIEALAYFAEPFIGFSAKECLKKNEILIRNLRVLEIVNLREFLAIPTAQVIERFGEEAARIYAAIATGHEVPWPKFEPDEDLIEKMDCDGLVMGADVLEAFMRRFEVVTEKVMLRLRGRARRLEALELRIRTSKEDRKIHLGFAIPQGTFLAIRSSVDDRLNVIFSKKPLIGETKEFSVRVLKSSPARVFQKEFFSRRDEQGEAWRSLLLRLTERLGASKVFVAKMVEQYIPEKAWSKSVSDEAPWDYDDGFASQGKLSQKQTPLRPLRVFRQPVALQQNEKGQLVYRSRVLEGFREAPEKLSGEWWATRANAESKESREYFKLKTLDQKTLWIFKVLQGRQPRYFLHGVFD